MKNYKNYIAYILRYIWDNKLEFLLDFSFKKALITGIIMAWSCIFMHIVLIAEVALTPEKEKPPTPIGFYEWEPSGYEGFLGRLKETILSVGENGNSVVFIGSIYTPEEAMIVTKEEVTEFNHIVDMKHADFNAGILAKINPAFRYRLEAYLLKDKNFIILVPSGTDITNFFKIEELRKII